MPLLDVTSLTVSSTALLGILILGNLVPLGMIAAIYWYVTNKTSLPTAHPHPHPRLVALARRSGRAA
jgi:hypothetical protein